MNDVRTSVIICAYSMDRWNDLCAAIESAQAQPETSEIILVIDHEEHLLARACTRWPDLGIVANAQRQGLAGARNTGVDWATGDIVAFLDDDATATPQWLSGLLEPFVDPHVVGVGGAAVPEWPRGAPAAVLPPELLWVVGCSYRGQPTQLASVRNVLGCSMAFRRAALLDAGGFDVNTGRLADRPLGCEETDVCIRLCAADPSRRIVYNPVSVVRHHVSADRMTWRYLCRRSYFEGVSKRQLQRNNGWQRALATERHYVRRVLPRGFVREVLRLHLRAAAAMTIALASAACGYLAGGRSAVPSNRPRTTTVVPL